MYRFKISKPLGNVGHKYIMREIQGSLDCFDGQMEGGGEGVGKDRQERSLGGREQRRKREDKCKNYANLKWRKEGKKRKKGFVL